MEATAMENTMKSLTGMLVQDLMIAALLVFPYIIISQ